MTEPGTATTVPSTGGDTRPVRVGLLGAGVIAGEMAAALAESERCVPWSVASRSVLRAAEFAERHGVQRSAALYEELLADPEVDVVYIATPHTEHVRWATAAIKAGKHVLCEKPIAVNAAEAAELIDTARTHGAFLLEAFAYRFHPQTKTLLELVADGAIGRLKAIDVTFSFAVDEGAPARLSTNELAGGGILDVGCYCTSMSSAIIGAATGATASEPDEVVALGVLDAAEGIDLYTAGVLKYAGNILAQVACGVALTQDDHIRVYGTEGHLHVPVPCWLGGHRHSDSHIELARPGEALRRIAVPGGASIFALELDAMAAMLEQGVETCHGSWEESLANMRTLDRWREAVGVRYACEGG
jgi:predicted dehydrogenase